MPNAQAIAQRDETQHLPVQSESAAMFSLIERMASDPNIDLDRVERVIAMRDKMQAQEAEKVFNAAMAAAQREMGTVAVNATNPQTRSKYATYDALDRALRPIYTRHGFALSFDETDSPKPDHIRIICILSHEGGHSRVYHRDMDASGKGAKGGDVMTRTHALGAAQSYAMRYLLRMVFNVATGEGDTDGNDAGVPITDEQRDRLLALADEVGADLEKFCAYFRIDAVGDLPAKRFDNAVSALKAKAKKESAQ